jgi:hypothetical protein
MGKHQQLNYHFNPFLIFTFLFKNLHNIIKTGFVLSIKYKALKTTLSKINHKTNSSKNTHNTYSNSILKNIRYVSIPFYKYNYNKLIYLILNKLLVLYQSNINSHTLSIKNIPINNNLFFYTFINLFYFKVRNY